MFALKAGGPVGNLNHSAEPTIGDNVPDCAGAPASPATDNRPARGTSRDHTMAQLHKRAPELYERAARGEMSAHAAAIEAGIRPAPPTPFV